MIVSYSNQKIPNGKLISEYDLYLFHEGSHFRSYRMLGAHITVEKSIKGVRFTVWAPNAAKVCVAGDFNKWGGKTAGDSLQSGQS